MPKYILTKTDLKIEHYFKQFPELVIRSDIHTLAADIGVSASAISKYIKKIDLESFTQYKLELAKQDYINNLDHQIKNDDDILQILQKLQLAVNNSIDQTVSNIQLDTLQAAVDCLNKAKRIFLFGIGASGIVCSDLYYKLSRIGKFAIYHIDSHIQLASVCDATPEDVVLGISYSGKTKEVLTAISFAHQAQVPTLTISAVGHNPLDDISTFSFKLPRHEQDFRSAAITSRNDSLFITDLLYLALIHKNPDAIAPNLQQSLYLTRQLKNDD